MYMYIGKARQGNHPSNIISPVPKEHQQPAAIAITEKKEIKMVGGRGKGKGKGKGKGREHVLLVVFPAQGHISPALQLAFKIVAHSSIDLTFLTSSSAVASILIGLPPTAPALNFAAFSQGNLHNDDDAKDYMHTLCKHGSQSVRDIIHSTKKGQGQGQGQGGHPITRILYTTLLPWAANVAREFGLPSVLLWTQPVTTFLTFHYYFTGYEDAINKVCNQQGTEDDSTIQLPRLPLLSSRDLHSFMLPSNPFKGAINTFKEHLEALEAEETPPTILVNSYDALEEEALQAMIPKYKTMGIGPLIPSSVFDTRETTCEVVSLVPDLAQKSKDDCQWHGWLNSKAEGSVIYVSFGSHVKQSKAQTEEIAKGLLASGHPFLWVITSNEEEEGDEIMEQNLVEEIQEKGMIVPWCAQFQVLKHPSVGCFMTHCGWNSTLESIACGVPMIGFPKMFDQPTISKLIAHVWKVGVRVNAAVDGIVGQEVIKNCIESVMDPDGIGRELNENVRKFMSLGKKAAEEGGSSHNNFKAFLQDMTGGTTTIN